MAQIAIVYHSGFGHTKVMAERVKAGAESIPGSWPKPGRSPRTWNPTQPTARVPSASGSASPPPRAVGGRSPDPGDCHDGEPRQIR